MDHIKNKVSSVAGKISELIGIMQELRGEGGCPWDKEQDHDSIKPYLIEEVYEVLEAIEETDDKKLMEELGDLILQVVFHAQIAKERGAFGIEEVLDGINSKLRSRHPHVFGEEHFETPAEVLANWERIKQEERVSQNGKKGALAGLPKGLPALLMARRIQDKLSRQGKEIAKEDSFAIEEKFEAFRQSLSGGKQEKIENALADLLFIIVGLAREKGVDAENTLRKKLDKMKMAVID